MQRAALSLGVLFVLTLGGVAAQASGLLDAVFTWGLGRGHLVVEHLLGQTPEATVLAYMVAAQRRRRKRALSLWPPIGRHGIPYAERRERVTGELLLMGPELRFQITAIEWWSTYGRIAPTDDPGEAGLARVSVAVDGPGGLSRLYLLDVSTTRPYGAGATGNPVRCWMLIDVYGVNEAPFAFPRRRTTTRPQAA